MVVVAKSATKYVICDSNSIYLKSIVDQLKEEFKSNGTGIDIFRRDGRSWKFSAKHLDAVIATLNKKGIKFD